MCENWFLHNTQIKADGICHWCKSDIEISDSEEKMLSEKYKLNEVHVPNVIGILPVEIVDFINYFCDVVKNTDVCRDGEIQAEWIKYNATKDGKVSV